MHIRITPYALMALFLAGCSTQPQEIGTQEANTPSFQSTPKTLTPETKDSMAAENQADGQMAQKEVTGSYNALSAAEAKVIVNKGTDFPGDGGYTLTSDPGTYLCRQCNARLYRADDKFESHCGWPSFDDEIDGAVTRLPDADGRRVEIVCANCDGHLGHVFQGERMTEKNTRHCVNSTSMTFIAQGKELPAKIILSE